MHRHMLWAVTVHTAHQLAEARPCILQHPVARSRGLREKKAPLGALFLLAERVAAVSGT